MGSENNELAGKSQKQIAIPQFSTKKTKLSSNFAGHFLIINQNINT